MMMFPLKLNCGVSVGCFQSEVKMQISILAYAEVQIIGGRMQLPDIMCVKACTCMCCKWKYEARDNYLTLGFRGPTWSPGAETETPCAPPGSLAPVRRAGGTAGARRTERAHCGRMDQPWRPSAEPNRGRNRDKLQHIKSCRRVRRRAAEVKLRLPELLGSASSPAVVVVVSPPRARASTWKAAPRRGATPRCW